MYMNFVRVLKIGVAFFGLLVAVEGSFLFAVFLFSNNQTLPERFAQLIAPEEEDHSPYYEHGLYSKDFYDLAYKRAGLPEHKDAKSAIVAHHLLVSDKIAEIFSTLASDNIKTVVLISPNHFSLGMSPAQVSKGSWTTPYSELYSNDIEIQKSVDSVIPLKIEESAFAHEHGISVLTPFIKKSFPNAKIVPIVLDESLTKEQAKEIGQGIADVFPDAVVFGSMDMSHNLPESVAEFHDSVTKHVIVTGGICEACDIDLEIDSNATMQTLLALNAIRKTQVWHMTHRGSSFSSGATSDWRENTSHILGYFENGAPVLYPSVSFLAVGDIMLDRGVRVKTNEFGMEYIWEEMQRFLRGTHFVVGNLEGTVNEQQSTYTYNPPFRFVFSPESVEEMGKYIDVVSLANNHASDVGSKGEEETHTWLDQMEIPWFGSYRSPAPRYNTTIDGLDLAIIGYHQFQPNETLLKEEIKLAKEDGRFVIVMPHWGTEYSVSPDSSQKRLAKLMVDAGADLIIGGHPHVAQGMEIIDDVPVIYSLGNFVFDQQIPATWNALTAGITISNYDVTIHLLPVYTRDGAPTPMDELSSESLINSLAKASPDYLQEQILQRIITQTYE